MKINVNENTTPPAFLVMPLWEVMYTFGSGMMMGMPEVYFVNNEIEVLNDQKS